VSGHANGGVAFSWGLVVVGVIVLGLSAVAGWLCPGLEVAGTGVHGRKRSKSGRDGGLPPLRPHASRQAVG
jgi:hypothetical protein